MRKRKAKRKWGMTRISLSEARPMKNPAVADPSFFH